MDQGHESVFSALTLKQHEALQLACGHLTSKQIAKRLGVAPVTIDKRIDTVRAKLGNISRVELLHLYQAWQDRYDRIIPNPIILPPQQLFTPRSCGQGGEHTFRFDDSLVSSTSSPWGRSLVSLRSEISPSDLGVAGKLIAIVLGALAILMAVVLSLAVAASLGTILKV